MQREVWAILGPDGAFIAAFGSRFAAELKVAMSGQDDVCIRQATLIIAGDVLNPCRKSPGEWQCQLPAGHAGPCQE